MFLFCFAIFKKFENNMRALIRTLHSLAVCIDHQKWTSCTIVLHFFKTLEISWTQLKPNYLKSSSVYFSDYVKNLFTGHIMKEFHIFVWVWVHFILKHTICCDVVMLFNKRSSHLGLSSLSIMTFKYSLLFPFTEFQSTKSELRRNQWCDRCLLQCTQ